MARAVGDITLDWAGTVYTAAAWASGGPDGLATATFSGLSDEIDLSALDNVEDVLVALAYDCNTAPTAGTFLKIHAAAPLITTGPTKNYPARTNNYRQVGPAVETDANTDDQWSNSWSLKQAFGGVLPPFVKFAVENRTGVTLAGTAGQAVENFVAYMVVFRNAKLS